MILTKEEEKKLKEEEQEDIAQGYINGTFN